MILGLPQTFPADEIERRLPDVASARKLLAGPGPLDDLLSRRREEWAALIAAAADPSLFERSADALTLAYARLAVRHGRLGTDFHAYHSEGHVLDICAARIDRVVATTGLNALPLQAWCALMLFGGGHDLRQREAPHLVAGVGANERASIEETERVLDVCGFSRQRDANLYIALELMIAGSTFDAGPPADGYFYNAAELVQSGGALAARLHTTLDAHDPDWRSEPAMADGHHLALIAADLDTANVAEPFAQFTATAENLCREREMLAGRSLDAGDSALPVLRFLTDGQERFFFELHTFQSEAGRAAFEAGKIANAPKLKALCTGLRARIELVGPAATGEQVIEAYRSTAATVLADCHE